MLKKDFLSDCKRYGWYILEQEHEGTPGIFVGMDHECPDWFIPLSGIEKAPDYQALLGGRDVKHMTRVVGYYSFTKDWNKSKLGELADRRKGDYGIGNTDSGRHMIEKMKREKEGQTPERRISTAIPA